jgi:fatty-acyl-CoA synthase
MPRSPHWPAGLPQHLELPLTSLYENLAISARRYPQRAATVYYGAEVS